MNKSEYIKFLEDAKARASRILAPATAEVVLNGDSAANTRFGGATGLNAMIDAIKADDATETAAQYAELVARAHSGDVEAKAEVTEIRVLRTNNFLMATSAWLGTFFNNVNIPQGTQPYWLNESRFETKASYMGADGGRRLSQLTKSRERVGAEWRKITSETVEYPLVDPLRKGVAEETKALVDIAGDLDENISLIAKPFVTGACVASWTNSGKRGSITRTFVLHSSVAADNIPDGNQLDVHTAGRFGKAAMDAIIGYCTSWGKLFNKRVLRPVAVLIPSKDYNGILADVTLTSQPNSVVEQVLTNGMLMHYAGVDWNLIPDETLSSDAGFAYVKFDQDFGEFYTMSELDEVHDDPVTKRRENKGEMDMSKWISFIVPLPNYPKVARVQYK